MTWAGYVIVSVVAAALAAAAFYILYVKYILLRDYYDFLRDLEKNHLTLSHYRRTESDLAPFVESGRKALRAWREENRANDG